MAVHAKPLTFFWGLTAMRWGDEDTTHKDEKTDLRELLITILCLIVLAFLLAAIVAVSR